ncbi:peptide deformylase [Brevibacillus agri]|uniref:Peptide deformylase n=1 Tax=Brevibacillus agri TaxID=51101 RepID=A0A3M8ANW8_9BACL|nr:MULTISPECIES: peptide deformylase [Brevibacillus]ELK40120.1 peptide deformylase [Brevibacillus agri BAB-2500]MBG9564713.1 peptide deformylase [Brevibacillus agri]MBY0054359.1 peptide deformylase [Brevibacillus agri]MDN4095281.1 peptide deformylase [Brevibacillus agri]MDR9505926.1 peptide deformylase [Brevibacillus agri]
MAVKTILPFGDPILRKTAKPVTEFNDRLGKLLDDMTETLYAKEGRAGLAAPQVGFLRRVIVMDCGDGLIELINPEILELDGEQIGPEACLSFPGYSGIVKRAQYVKIQSANRAGETFTLEGEGFLARCIQHEIDHLNGVLFVDRIDGDKLYHDQTKRKVNLMDVWQLTKKQG